MMLYDWLAICACLFLVNDVKTLSGTVDGNADRKDQESKSNFPKRYRRNADSVKKEYGELKYSGYLEGNAIKRADINGAFGVTAEKRTIKIGNRFIALKETKKSFMKRDIDKASKRSKRAVMRGDSGLPVDKERMILENYMNTHLADYIKDMNDPMGYSGLPKVEERKMMDKYLKREGGPKITIELPHRDYKQDKDDKRSNIAETHSVNKKKNANELIDDNENDAIIKEIKVRKNETQDGGNEGKTKKDVTDNQSDDDKKSDDKQTPSDNKSESKKRSFIPNPKNNENERSRRSIIKREDLKETKKSFTKRDIEKASKRSKRGDKKGDSGLTVVKERMMLENYMNTHLANYIKGMKNPMEYSETGYSEPPPKVEEHMNDPMAYSRLPKVEEQKMMDSYSKSEGGPKIAIEEPHQYYKQDKDDKRSNIAETYSLNEKKKANELIDSNENDAIIKERKVGKNETQDAGNEDKTKKDEKRSFIPNPKNNANERSIRKSEKEDSATKTKNEKRSEIPNPREDDESQSFHPKPVDDDFNFKVDQLK